VQTVTQHLFDWNKKDETTNLSVLLVTAETAAKNHNGVTHCQQMLLKDS
jgi:hypothetical protein